MHSPAEPLHQDGVVPEPRYPAPYRKELETLEARLQRGVLLMEPYEDKAAEAGQRGLRGGEHVLEHPEYKKYARAFRKLLKQYEDLDSTARAETPEQVTLEGL